MSLFLTTTVMLGSPDEFFCDVCFYETEGEYPLDTVLMDVEGSSVPFVTFEINDYFLGFAGVAQYVVLRTPLCQLLRPPPCLQIHLLWEQVQPLRCRWQRWVRVEEFLTQAQIEGELGKVTELVNQGLILLKAEL